MVEIFGSVVESRSDNGRVRMTFEIPAFSKRIAQRRAKRNMSSKGMNDVSVRDIRGVKSTNVPGQSVYTITVSGSR